MNPSKGILPWSFNVSNFSRRALYERSHCRGANDYPARSAWQIRAALSG